MSFEVTWSEESLKQLQRLMYDHQHLADRIMSASEQIDRELEQAPESIGESQQGDYRIHFTPPLSIYFKVILEHRRVVIAAVGHFGKD